MADEAEGVPGALLAELLDLTPRRIQQLAKEGHVKRASRTGRYLLGPSVRSYVQFLRRKIAAREGPEEDLTRDRIRIQRAKAESAELDLAQRKGELVPGDQIEGALVALHSGIRTRLMAVPAKVAPIVHAAQTTAEAESIIRKHQEEALQEIASAQVL